MAVSNLKGDISAYTKLVFKLEDFTNSVENKLTIYFKGNIVPYFRFDDKMETAEYETLIGRIS